ncbi:MAG TPA: serine hydrolase [Flavobacteriales bacterium]|nr:serine hydrolase [Flavobacteriales bacterium]
MRFLILTALFFCCCTGKSQTFDQDLKRIVYSYNSKGRFNGVVIVAFNKDDIRTYKFGYKDPVTKKQKIELNDRFYLASVAKHFTGWALLQLIDSGLVKPTDTIGKWFTELKPKLQKVTVRQLANHTSGIPDFYDLTKDVDTLDNNKIYTMLCQLDSTDTKPGKMFNYCNAGYVLMAMLVERVTGLKFDAYCRQFIFEPLGMKGVSFMPSKDTILCGFSPKYQKKTVTSGYCGPSGLYCKASDFIAYYKNYLAEIEKWNGYAKMALALTDTSYFNKKLYGFGWIFANDELGSYHYHPGDEFRFFNLLQWYEEKNVMVCILSNKRDRFLNALHRDVLELVRKQVK